MVCMSRFVQHIIVVGVFDSINTKTFLCAFNDRLNTGTEINCVFEFEIKRVFGILRLNGYLIQIEIKWVVEIEIKWVSGILKLNEYLVY